MLAFSTQRKRIPGVFDAGRTLLYGMRLPPMILILDLKPRLLAGLLLQLGE
jgi:hypothetical protein